MNTILQKRIEEATLDAVPPGTRHTLIRRKEFIKGATFALRNQWISVEEALPEGDRILAKLSKSFCNEDNCYEILCRIAKEYVDLKHPDGYYDLCGESVPASAIIRWMPIPQNGGEK